MRLALQEKTFDQEALRMAKEGLGSVGMKAKSEGGFIPDLAINTIGNVHRHSMRAIDKGMDVAAAGMDAGLKIGKTAADAGTRVGRMAVDTGLTVANAATPVLQQGVNVAMKGGQFVGGKALDGAFAGAKLAGTGVSKLGVAAKAKGFAGKLKFNRLARKKQQEKDAVAKALGTKVQFVGWAPFVAMPWQDGADAIDAAANAAAVREWDGRGPEVARAAKGEEYTGRRIMGLPAAVPAGPPFAATSPGQLGQVIGGAGLGHVYNRVHAGSALDGSWSADDGHSEPPTQYVCAVVYELPPEPEPEPEFEPGPIAHHGTSMEGAIPLGQQQTGKEKRSRWRKNKQDGAADAAAAPPLPPPSTDGDGGVSGWQQQQQQQQQLQHQSPPPGAGEGGSGWNGPPPGSPSGPPLLGDSSAQQQQQQQQQWQQQQGDFGEAPLPGPSLLQPGPPAHPPPPGRGARNLVAMPPAGPGADGPGQRQ